MLSCTVDTSRLEEALRKASQFTTKTDIELVNRTLFFVARGALYHTYAPAKEKIQAALNKVSNKSGTASVANILVNYKRGQQGKVGLYGAKMKIASDSLVRVEVSHRNFARAGFAKVANDLAPLVKGKQGAKPASGVRVKLSNSGTTVPARIVGGRVTAEFSNNISGKDNQSTVQKYQQEGLQKAVDEEATEKFEHAAQRELEEGFISIFK